MRLAFSAATGLSGLVLLGLAIYGQPAAYVDSARAHLTGWFNEEREAYRAQHPAPDEKVTERMAQLQNE
ncbi:MAG TPA: hypothetical protein VE690_09475, partial [Rhodopila sp.]|nr:hypothetical protein [Rhodopila sp.]